MCQTFYYNRKMLDEIIETQRSKKLSKVKHVVVGGVYIFELYSFIQFIKYLLSTNYMPDIVSGKQNRQIP